MSHHPLPTCELPMVSSDRPGYFRTIELEVCTACDLACFGCDRFSDVTNAPNMTVQQVELFVRESLELGWEWERIRVLGGEPTLHPQFRNIVIVLLAYRCVYPNCFIQVLTNGHGKSAQHAEWLAERSVDLHAEYKDGQPGWFRNTRIAPVDRDPSVGSLPPCGIHDRRGCGIGLTRNGYFLDGAGAAVARVAGLDVGKTHLREVTQDAMLEQAKVLCRLCGHWNPTDGSEVTKQVTETGYVTGPYWTEKLAAYAKQRPPMRVYGS